MPHAFDWTEARVKHLTSLFHRGDPYREIAVALGTSQGPVQRKLADLGLRRGSSVQNAQEFWTAERVRQLRRLHADGDSYSNIARLLGVTRNAVCAKCDRLGLKRRRAEPPARVPAAAKAAFVAEPLPESKDELPPLVGDLIHLTAHQCKWPIGTGPYAFCGRYRPDEGPYCAHHTAVAAAPQRHSARRKNTSELIRGLRRYL